MIIIGLTGGSGVGKTSVMQVWAARGALTIDADAVYHRLLREDTALLDALRAHFPEAFESGTLDRKALGGLVFADEARRKLLEQLTHGAVIADIEAQLARARDDGRRVAAVDALYLLEGPLRSRCRAVVGVVAPHDARVARIKARDGVKTAYAEARLRAQREDGYFRSGCDYIIKNDSTPEELAKRAQEVYDVIVKMYL